MTAPPPPDPSTSPARPRRPSTILGRLAEAVREQNWFAVVLEVCIVIVGVVIGFQVNAWGQARADEAQEQVYLRQLVADLSETERIMTDRDARMDAGTHYAYNHLLNSFGQRDRPPRDSVVAWFLGIDYTATPRPVLGTAEALVASGDFGGVADDSLRAAILRYLDKTRERMADQEDTMERRFALSSAIYQDYDRATLFEVRFDIRQGYMLSFIAQDADSTAVAASPAWEHPFPYDPLDIYDDPALLRTLLQFGDVVRDLMNERRTYRESAAALREQIETYLDR